MSDPEGAVYRMAVFAVPRKSVLGQVVNPAVWWGWLKGEDSSAGGEPKP